MFRRRPTTVFRPSSATAQAHVPSRLQAAVLLLTVLAVAAAVTVVSYTVKASRASSFHLFYGSVFVNDDTSPVGIDLASGKPTVRLRNAFNSVSAHTTAQLDVVPLGQRTTLMLNPVTGEFNMIDSTGFVLKNSGGGVRLPSSTGPGTSVQAVPADGSAYLLQSGPARSSVYLVGQLTVAEAIGPAARGKARGYATLGQPVADVPDPAAATGTQLWLLTGPDSARTITRLSLPPDSATGVTLTRTNFGSFAGPGAVESAKAAVDDPTATVAAVATPGELRVVEDGTVRHVPVDVSGTVDRILAVTDAVGRFAFLYHTGNGWNLVTTPVAGGAAGVVPLPTIAGTALATPAMSAGKVYTMDAAGSASTLWQIDGSGARPVPGAARYPLLDHERGDFAGAQVLAEGDRVVFNSRADYQAVVVFTDGSRGPRTIDKHSAVQVDPSGATTLAEAPSRGRTHSPTPPQPTKSPRPAQAVTAKVNCNTTTQIPHIPTVQLLERGSRSVGLQWNYPLLTPDDCAPSTYTITTETLTSGAPRAPNSITVHGQTSVTLTGLFPDTDYRITVTAWLNNRGTSSIPLSVRTDVEGPAAPTDVRTTVDNAGNWTVTWTSCGSVASGCVAVADWEIIPKYCDGVGLSGAPATAHLVGDPTLRHWSYTYPGSDALLGRGLSFLVEGLGTEGTVGTPTSDGGCAYSWTPPVQADIHASASAPAQTASSTATTDVTVSVAFTKSQVHDLGGVGGQLTYQLLGADGTVVSHTGPTTAAVATLAGITAGQRYQVVVTATPPKHPEAAVTLAPVDVTPAIATWPTPTVSASFTGTTATAGTLAVAVGLGGADTRGETFDLTGSSLDCANAHRTLDATGIAAGTTVTFPVDRQAYYGNHCTVTVQLVQNAATATDPALYGAGPSASVTSSELVIPAPDVTVTASDFSASFVSTAPRDQPQIAVRYTGKDDETAMSNWSIVLGNGTRSCGSASSAPDVTLDVDPSCVPGATQWSVQVSYSYYGHSPSFTVPVNGSAPAPVDPTKITFDPPTWDPQSPDVIVHYTGSYGSDTLDSLSWTETVTSNGQTCGTGTAAPSATGTGPSIAVDTTACPSSSTPSATSDSPTPSPIPNTYTLTIHYDDPYGSSDSYTLTVTGNPPS